MYDVILKQGNIVDGTGRKVYQGDIAISGNCIVDIGSDLGSDATTCIDASEKFVCPGFIDAHAHTDALLLYCPDALGKIMQGVTTDVSGLCGTSLHPLADVRFREDALRYRNSFLPNGVEARECTEAFSQFEPHLMTNMPMFVGQGTLRISVMGFENRIPKPDEMAKMKSILRNLLKQGAFGLSSGLSYIPGAFTSTDELVELCKELVPFHGIYNTHLRNESNTIVQSVEEAMRIGRESGCRVHISHHKVMGYKNHGKTKETLCLMEDAKREGVEVTCDMYPYTAGSIGINSLAPSWVFADGFNQAMQYIQNSVTRKQLLVELAMDTWENVMLACGADKITLGFAQNCERYEGWTIRDIALAKGLSDQEALLTLLVECKGVGMIVFHALSAADVNRVMQYSGCCIGTDAYARPYDGILSEGKPHPRNYSGFIRYLKKYIIEDKLFTIEAGIQKITSLPAKIFALGKRGSLKIGYIADITVWNPTTLSEEGDFLNPVRQPKGIEYVLINGKIIVNNGIFTGRLEGRMLRHTVSANA